MLPVISRSSTVVTLGNYSILASMRAPGEAIFIIEETTFGAAAGEDASTLPGQSGTSFKAAL
jgi:hypothetical protein